MFEVSLSQNVLIQYLIWHFFDVPKSILKAWRNFFLFELNYFSILLLLKTLFSHWRRYKWARGRGFDIREYLEVAVSNLISRILGAIVRTALIFIGLSVETFIIFSGILVFFGWLFLPAVLFFGLYFGFKILLF